MGVDGSRGGDSPEGRGDSPEEQDRRRAELADAYDKQISDNSRIKVKDGYLDASPRESFGRDEEVREASAEELFDEIRESTDVPGRADLPARRDAQASVDLSSNKADVEVIVTYASDPTLDPGGFRSKSSFHGNLAVEREDIIYEVDNAGEMVGAQPLYGNVLGKVDVTSTGKHSWLPTGSSSASWHVLPTESGKTVRKVEDQRLGDGRYAAITYTASDREVRGLTARLRESRGDFERRRL